MRTILIAIVLPLSLILTAPIFAGKGGGGSSGGSKSGSSSSSTGTVHVNGYVRKDGTFVAPYDRKAPGSTKTNTAATQGNVNSQPAPTASTSQVPPPLPLVAKATSSHPTPLPNPSAVEHVYIDSAAKLYYRADCAHEHADVTMTKARAISSGYRPAPDCYGHR